MARVLRLNFVEPAWVWLGIFGGNNLYDVAVVERSVERDHLAIDDGARTGGANLAMKAIGEIEWLGTLWKIYNVALWRVDEDFVGKKGEFELVSVDFFAASELGGGLLEFLNPEKVAWKLADAALGVGARELLLVVEEGGRKTALGVIVHFLGTNLELDDLFVWGDDGGVKRLITVLLWHRDVIFDAAVHRMEEGMDEAEDEIASRDVFDDEA